LSRDPTGNHAGTHPPGMDHMLRAGKRAFAVGIRKVAEMTVNEASQGLGAGADFVLVYQCPFAGFDFLDFLPFAFCCFLCFLMPGGRESSLRVSQPLSRFTLAYHWSTSIRR
jgi:hypothetical protein